MWVQYKQGQVITTQQQSIPQTQSLRYHASDKAQLQKIRLEADCAPRARMKNIDLALEDKQPFKKSQQDKQNHFIGKPLLEPAFSSKALLFTDELEPISGVHHTQSAARAQHVLPPMYKRSVTKQDHLLIAFAFLYLLGASLSGVLYAMLSSAQAQYLSYYLSHFIEVFEITSVSEYCINLSSVCIISLTSVVLLGLSALGVPFLLVLLFLKGIGSGIMLLQFCTQYRWNGLLYYFASVGIAEICLATGICFLACTAAKSSNALFQAVFSPQLEGSKGKIRPILAQYLALILFLVVICLLCAVIFCGFFRNFQLG